MHQNLVLHISCDHLFRVCYIAAGVIVSCHNHSAESGCRKIDIETLSQVLKFMASMVCEVCFTEQQKGAAAGAELTPLVFVHNGEFKSHIAQRRHNSCNWSNLITLAKWCERYNGGRPRAMIKIVSSKVCWEVRVSTTCIFALIWSDWNVLRKYSSF